MFNAGIGEISTVMSANNVSLSRQYRMQKDKRDCACKFREYLNSVIGRYV